MSFLIHLFPMPIRVRSLDSLINIFSFLIVFHFRENWHSSPLHTWRRLSGVLASVVFGTHTVQSNSNCQAIKLHEYPTIFIINTNKNESYFGFTSFLSSVWLGGFSGVRTLIQLFRNFLFRSFATPDVAVYYPLEFPISDKPFLRAGPPEPSSWSI